MKLRWIDIAKSLAIFLVVLGHVQTKVFVDLTGHEVVIKAWDSVGDILPILRMPMFFMISGILAAKSVVMPWRLVVKRRVLRMYFIYAIWLVIGTIFFLFFRNFNTSIPRSIPRFISELFLATSYLWYLYALIVYFVIVKVFHRARLAILLVGTLSALILAGDFLPIHIHGNLQSLGRSFVYFAVGIYFSKGIKQLVESKACLLLVVSLASGVLLTMTQRATGLQWLEVFTAVPLVFAAFGLCRVAGTHTPIALDYLGKKTLPIYVLHIPLLAIVHSCALKNSFTLPAALFALLPMVISIVVIWSSLAIHKFMSSMNLGFMFGTPKSMPAASLGMGRKGHVPPL